MYQFKEGDIVTLKKPHNKVCGSHEWQLVTNGVYVTIKCMGCERVTKIKRIEFNRRIKQIHKVGEQNEE